MKFKSLQKIITLLFVFSAFNSWGQMFDREHQGKYPYKISLGFNALDFSFRTVQGDFEAVEFNMEPYPTRLTVERILSRNLSVEAAFTYNVLKEGTIIWQFPIGGGGAELLPITEDWKYYSYDANLKFYFKNLIYIHHKFDPYINSGLGYTVIHDEGNMNLAVGGGFNLWPFMIDDYYGKGKVTDRIGFYAQFQGKISIAEPRADHYMQYSIGVIYKFK